jgi:hypothetical protein
MLSGRTRALFAISSLAPASILIWRLYVQSLVREATAKGEFAGWYDPGILFYALLFVGLLSFVAGIVSLVMDMRGVRK